MLFLPPEHAQALRDLPDTDDNAFYWRERRRDERRGEPWRTLANTVLLLALVFTGALAGVWAIVVFYQDLPRWLGGPDSGRVTFALTAAIHALLVGHAARSRVYGVLAREASGGTLFQLLMTRVPAFQMLAQMAVYPFQQSALTALAGLPFYAMLIAWGSLGVQEVFVLYLLFLWLATTLPNWRTPALTEQTPEEIGQSLHTQERSAGCMYWVIAFVCIPGAVAAGGILWGIRQMNPAWGTRIPPEVWPMLPALPITFAWILVRVLTAPYTWYGLPLPLWTGVFPLLLLGRVSSLWISSLYLSVVDSRRIIRLPDVPAWAAWRRGLLRLFWLITAGYLWQPLLESDWLAEMVWPGPPPFTSAQNLGGLIWLAGGACLAVSVHRARCFAVTPRRDDEDMRRAARWIAAPLLPLALTVCVGAAAMPRAFITPPAALMLARVVAVGGSFLLFALSLGPGSAPVWTWTQVLALALPFIPYPPAAAPAALSVAVILGSLNPLMAARMPVSSLAYHLPAWWVAILVCLAGAAVGRALTRQDWFARRFPAQRRAVALRRIRPAPEPLPTLASSPPAQPPVPAVPPPPRAPQPAPVPAAPPVVPIGPATAPPRYGPPYPGPWPPQPSGAEWRWRPLSPAGAAALRWLFRRTDNPVALYSARRVLPGSLGNEQLTLGLVMLGFGLLVAFLLPELLVLVPFASWTTDLLLPLSLDRIPRGLAMLLSTMVLVTMFSPLRVCPLVANAYRSERERATLGFLLATPLPSRSLAVGHCIGGVLPGLTLWAGTTLAALLPVALLVLVGGVNALAALWAWAFGFLCSLLYLAMCAVCGAWIGISEVKARAMTVGVYLLPFCVYLVGAGAAAHAYLNRHWGYFTAVGLFLGVTGALLALMWRSTLGALVRMRRGDLPFEGRSVGT